MSGRKAFRYMERVLKPELDKHLVTFPLIRLGEMTLYCGLFEQRGATGGLDFFFLVCSSAARPEDGLMYRIEVSQHAMQRIIQRTGRTGEDEVRTRLYTAMANIYWLQPWVYREKWLQLGLACEEGVFIGEVRDDCYSIKTFIPAIDNGRPSRWRDLHRRPVAPDPATCSPRQDVRSGSKLDRRLVFFRGWADAASSLSAEALCTGTRLSRCGMGESPG
ncbi:hypothetical protein C7S15_2255 [Burkholderia cepacia]|uniref:hypothetical protein n=1 Tax=Burkholderia cepacia TaxID=292 RepID=UPI0029900B7C|nr:hypothetical protein [Burkholderia cepacia]MDW9227679.1 hypothetical protein [Burkholderia cepacia]